MKEQAMVTDALNSINASLKGLSDMIAQAEDQELRQTFIQMRNSAETCQHELYTIAKSKNYYQPAAKATQEEIMNVKNLVNQNSQQMESGQSQGQSSMGGQSSVLK
ncbi:MAG: coat protein [Anaerocolumna sp.]|jgi:spore coat protein CotF|nr:coat protein [Anaerocolumna sp.]